MDNSYQEAFGSLDAFRSAKTQLSSLENSHNSTVNNLCNLLSQEIRKRQPNVSIELRPGGEIKISYLSKSITLRPDVENKVWGISGSSPRFSSRFRQAAGRACDMDISSMGDLAQSVADFFTQYFKTIQKKKLLNETETHGYRRQHNSNFPFAPKDKEDKTMPIPSKTPSKPIAGTMKVLGETNHSKSPFKSEDDANQAEAAHNYRKDMADRNSKKTADRQAAMERMNPKNKKILGEEMAASAQPNDGLKALNGAMQATGLHQALAKSGIKNMLSKDKQSIIFYINMQGGQIRPLVSYPLIDLTKSNELESALDGLGDLSKNQAPGMSRQERQRIKDQETALRQAAQQFLPQKPKESKPIPQIFSNVV